MLLGIGIGALDVAMNAQAVLVEERYGRPIMSSFHGLFSLGGLVGAALAGGAMQVSAAARPAPGDLRGGARCRRARGLAAAPADAPGAGRRPAVRACRADGSPCSAGSRSIAFMAEGAMGDWSAIYIRMDLGASPATAALGFAAFSLTMALGRFTGDRLVARFSPAAILAPAP